MTTSTITRQQLAASLASDYQITKKMGHELLDDLVDQITRHLKRGEKIRIAGLGILQVRKRAARMGRNPATGEANDSEAKGKLFCAGRYARVISKGEDPGALLSRSPSWFCPYAI